MKCDKNEFRKLIKTKLETRNIVIWGTDENAKRFYLGYKEQYHITACISSEEGYPEYLISEDDGLRVMTWEQYKRKSNDYIILFEEPYVQKENQLVSEELVLFEDYAGRYVIEYVLSEKKLAIVAGNCQLTLAFDYLKDIKSFTNEYYVLRFTIHHWLSRWSQKTTSLLKDMCELYICMFHEEDDPLFFTREELPSSCKIVTVPLMIVRAYWPQKKSGWRSAKNEYFIYNKKMKSHGPFEYGDININRMIKEGASVDEIVNALTSDDFYTEKQVQEHVEMSLRVQEYAEQECDIKLAGYIRDNYKKKKLYRDMAHMEPILICELVRQILLYLDMDDSEIDMILDAGIDNPVYREHSIHCTQVPIYPSVAKYMGLEWYHKDMTWDVTFYSGLKKLTFEEYIRAYYSLCSKMKQIMEEW